MGVENPSARRIIGRYVEWIGSSARVRLFFRERARSIFGGNLRRLLDSDVGAVTERAWAARDLGSELLRMSYR